MNYIKLATLVASGLAACHASAQLAVASGSLSAYTGVAEPDSIPNTFNHSFTGELATIFLDYTYMKDDDTTELLASAEAYGGLRPQTIATAFRSDSDANNDHFRIRDPQASAVATLEYEFHVRPIGSLPDGWTEFSQRIPLTMTAILEASYYGFEGSSAGASARTIISSRRFGNVWNRIFEVSADADGEVDSINEVIHTVARPTDLYSVSLRSQVSAEAYLSNNDSIPNHPTGEAMAIADPFIEFDQAAFDQMQADLGEATFNLSDYFTIEYSEGIIPSPGTMGLLALGGLFGARRRR